MSYVFIGKNSDLLSLRVTWIFLSFVAQYPNKWYLFFHKYRWTMTCSLTVNTISDSSTPASSLSTKGLQKLLRPNKSTGCQEKLINNALYILLLFTFWKCSWYSMPIQSIWKCYLPFNFPIFIFNAAFIPNFAAQTQHWK